MTSLPALPRACRPDGTPYAAGIGAHWLDGDLYFISGLPP
jgi:hypothetical protein